ncbi:6-phosphogluconolactonase [Rhodobacter veldkampii DSM 11550]|uniref:6-phosphogluconolactonase n=1 Tax=Phaeovulum veldkampii DSM 11550 TaxID=1185920 RepID=A0A2T4JHR2_9RHOB|nr:6-phosphogluconolactonase [Phaeovulum veldkampii]MBK5947709.1 6-phosphogluconolactonase [Phaeovulum veldkampii DSM 11550]NCU21095.1 6-phosphogluconolactonase [Candidatus Falkowbacteria bacterium]PTE17455.1 6-phosphogluconolactonase [Phaeovulum veldkampii DSM 11550]TDQ60328.1 6-phosphogluconolactonase [Phaeovulum veldkampii DSM 11550]
MKIIDYPDRELMALSLADRLASELSETLRMQGHASLCLPGGTTPGPVFDTLSGVDLDWAKVAVFLNDERWVPEDNPRSNTALLRARFLRGPAAAARLIPLYAAAPTPEDRLDELTAGITPHLPISVLLLGMGADMHTASLFPGADRLAQALAPDAPALMALRADAAGEPRITLTARVLKAALRLHILITGADKRAAIERAASLPLEQAPVRAVLSHATIHWAE